MLPSKHFPLPPKMSEIHSTGENGRDWGSVIMCISANTKNIICTGHTTASLADKAQYGSSYSAGHLAELCPGP